MSGGVRRGVIAVSALGLAAAAAGAAYVFAAPLWVVPLAALGAWGTVHAAFRPSRTIDARAKSPGLAQSVDWDVQIAQVAEASRRITALSERASDPLVRQRGKEVSTALNRVISHLREDPDDLLSSQKFLAVYVERTQVILARYVQLECLNTPQADQVRHRVRDELLPMLIRMCDAHLQRIMSDDLRAFETDVEVLWKSMNLEGL